MKQESRNLFKFLVILVALYSILSTPYSTFAQTASTSAQKAASPSATPNSSIKEKIEQLKKEIASKAADLKQEVNKKLQNKAIAGVVTEKTDTRLTLLTNKGSRTITINEYTEYLNGATNAKKLPVIALKNINKDDFVVSLGDMDDKNVLVAKKIIKQAKPKEVNNKITFGQIQSVSNPSIIIKDQKGEKITVTTNASTSFFLGKEEASFQDVKANKSLVSVGTALDNGVTRARFVYLIPTVGYFKPEKAKESPKPASPSASPKKS